MWKIKITWKQLYEDIYVKFTKNESDQKTFIKEIFPDGLYQKMFVRGGKVQGKYVSLVCRATIDAKKRFLDASDYLIQLKNEAHEDYNFEENPILQEFVENQIAIKHFELRNGIFIIQFLPLSDAEIEDLNFDRTKLIQSNREL